jgi:hypothetical protein
LKSEVNPVIGVVVIVIILAVVGIFLWRGASGGAAAKSAGQVGNPGPFAPGGVANGKGAKPATAPSGARPPGMPGQ